MDGEVGGETVLLEGAELSSGEAAVGEGTADEGVVEVAAEEGAVAVFFFFNSIQFNSTSHFILFFSKRNV